MRGAARGGVDALLQRQRGLLARLSALDRALDHALDPARPPPPRPTPTAARAEGKRGGEAVIRAQRPAKNGSGGDGSGAPSGRNAAQKRERRTQRAAQLLQQQMRWGLTFAAAPSAASTDSAAAAAAGAAAPASTVTTNARGERVVPALMVSRPDELERLRDAMNAVGWWDKRTLVHRIAAPPADDGAGTGTGIGTGAASDSAAAMNPATAGATRAVELTRPHIVAVLSAFVSRYVPPRSAATAPTPAAASALPAAPKETGLPQRLVDALMDGSVWFVAAFVPPPAPTRFSLNNTAAGGGAGAVEFALDGRAETAAAVTPARWLPKSGYYCALMPRADDPTAPSIVVGANTSSALLRNTRVVDDAGADDLDGSDSDADGSGGASDSVADLLGDGTKKAKAYVPIGVTAATAVTGTATAAAAAKPTAARRKPPGKALPAKPAVSASAQPPPKPHRVDESSGARARVLGALCPGVHSFRYIELFAGIGGFRLALDALGGTCVFASEIEPNARACYAANFHCANPPLNSAAQPRADAHGHVMGGDIRFVDAAAIPAHDVLTGGFPCQPFSAIGDRKGFADDQRGSERGALFWQIIRVLRHHKPRALVLENVPGLVTLDGGAALQTVCSAVSREGYTVAWHVIDAALLVPQHRRRVYIVGIRNDCVGVTAATASSVAVSVPKPVSAPLPWRCVYPPFIPDLQRAVREVMEPASVVPAGYTLTEQQWYRVTSLPLFRTHAHYKLARLERPAATLISSYRTALLKHAQLVPHPYAPHAPERLDAPPKLTSWGAAVSCLPPARWLTPRECARLQGFPERFRAVESDALPNASGELPRGMAAPKRRDASSAAATPGAAAAPTAPAAPLGVRGWYRAIGNAVCPPAVAMVMGSLLCAIDHGGQCAGCGLRAALRLAFDAMPASAGAALEQRVVVTCPLPPSPTDAPTAGADADVTVESRAPIPLGELRAALNDRGVAALSARLGPLYATLPPAALRSTFEFLF